MGMFFQARLLGSFAGYTAAGECPLIAPRRKVGGYDSKSSASHKGSGERWLWSTMLAVKYELVSRRNNSPDDSDILNRHPAELAQAISRLSGTQRRRRAEPRVWAFLRRSKVGIVVHPACQAL